MDEIYTKYNENEMMQRNVKENEEIMGSASTLNSSQISQVTDIYVKLIHNIVFLNYW